MLESIQQDVDKKVYFYMEISKLEQMRGEPGLSNK